MPIVSNATTVAPPGSTSRDLACLFIRLVAGVSMILYNSWLMVVQGWGYLWHKKDWTLLNKLEDMGGPFPVAIACVVASVFFLGSIFLILGVFGRFNTALLLICTEFVFYFALRDRAIAYVELSLLYGVLYLLNLILGTGRFSLDRVFSNFGRRRFRKRNPVDF